MNGAMNFIIFFFLLECWEAQSYSEGWVQSLDWTTGLDYWTHPNYKIHLVHCRIEHKHRYLFTPLLY